MTLLKMQPNTAAAGEKPRDVVIKEIADSMEKKTPELFDLIGVLKKYPTMYEESMNTILCQEVEKYNQLLDVMKVHLRDVKRALSGEIGMSE